MRHADSIKDIYNGLVHKYQFDHFAMQENRTPDNTRYFLSEKSREAMTHKLDMLAHFAHDLGEPELAGIVLDAAAQLGSDAVPPMPM
ncbi:hypothetical protein L9W80_18760 [Vibrio aestuarianus]|uniref:hypothetical protein n=1 Tax=Vibrio aestuarianus TaxID=28171 RepID=UPI00237C5AAB|nr:hypothetical protein [Vibrio aestuarianus]MDE1352180.1 hypothetical protein [Vibrio aestuarianus]